MKTEYTLTQFNPEHWNEFEHREVVFTRLALAGDGKTRPYSKVLQLWDKKTDTLILTLTLTESLEAASLSCNQVDTLSPEGARKE